MYVCSTSTTSTTSDDDVEGENLVDALVLLAADEAE